MFTNKSAIKNIFKILELRSTWFLWDVEEVMLLVLTNFPFHFVTIKA